MGTERNMVVNLKSEYEFSTENIFKISFSSFLTLQNFCGECFQIGNKKGPKDSESNEIF